MKPADSSIFTSTVPNPCKGCRNLEPQAPSEIEGKSCIGFCYNYYTTEGRVYAHHLPPCLTWRYEGDSDKG